MNASRVRLLVLVALVCAAAALERELGDGEPGEEPGEEPAKGTVVVVREVDADDWSSVTKTLDPTADNVVFVYAASSSSSSSSSLDEEDEEEEEEEEIQTAIETLRHVAALYGADWRDTIELHVTIAAVRSYEYYYYDDDDDDGVEEKKKEELEETKPWQIVAFRATPRDRSCLLAPPPRLSTPRRMPVSVASSPSSSSSSGDRFRVENDWMAFLNSVLGRYMTATGSMNAVGETMQRLEQQLHRVRAGDTCEEVQGSPTREQFLEEYVRKGKPVVFRQASSHWPALTKWTNEFLRRAAGERSVHVKLTPDGNFEGCESGEIWDDYKDRIIPNSVLQQLSFPDLVVVRPASADMPFSQFMDLLYSERNVSAYMEYTALDAYLPVLAEDVSKPSFADMLTQRHFNIWLGNGRTLGKLHFDPYENLLCQIAGTKEVTLFDPSENENLYEAHIPEAMLSYSFETDSFRRSELLESTSMVMSPVDIRSPDFKRFPRFAHAKSIQCDIHAGDILFMPAYWWHEVQSRPDAEHRNIAVNYWFDPVFEKDIPCDTCKRKYNMEQYGPSLLP